MTSADSATLAQLQAWRECGADRCDPAGFALIASLADRAQRYGGSARAQLDARLSQLTAAYAQQLATPAPSAAGDAGPGPLQSLLQQLAADPLQYQLPLHASRGAGDDTKAGESGDTALMPALDEFQQLWSRIRIDSLLRQCLDSLPEDAGPLHSSVLTYRAMALMQEISPEYLQHFIAYVDVLTWMEQLSAGGTAGSPDGKRKGPRRKRTTKSAQNHATPGP